MPVQHVVLKILKTPILKRQKIIVIIVKNSGLYKKTGVIK